MIVSPLNLDVSVLTNIRQTLQQAKVAGALEPLQIAQLPTLPVDEAFSTLDEAEFAEMTLNDFETLTDDPSAFYTVDFYTDAARTQLLFSDSTGSQIGSDGVRIYYTPRDAQLNGATGISTTNYQPIYYVTVYATDPEVNAPLAPFGSDDIPQNTCADIPETVYASYLIDGADEVTYDGFCVWDSEANDWALGGWTTPQQWTLQSDTWLGQRTGNAPEGVYSRVSGSDMTPTHIVSINAVMTNLVYRNVDNLLFQDVTVMTAPKRGNFPEVKNENSLVIVPTEENLKTRASSDPRDYLVQSYDIYVQKLIYDWTNLSEENRIIAGMQVGNLVRNSLYSDRYRDAQCTCYSPDLDGTFVSQFKLLPSPDTLRGVLQVKCVSMVVPTGY